MRFPGAADGRLRTHSGRPGDWSRSLAMTLVEMRERYVSAAVPSFWSVRNVLVCLAAAFILFACATCLLDEKYYVAGPLWLNVYGFALFFPCMVLVCGWVLLDKRWLFANIGFLRRWGRKRARAGTPESSLLPGCCSLFLSAFADGRLPSCVCGGSSRVINRRFVDGGASFAVVSPLSQGGISFPRAAGRRYANDEPRFAYRHWLLIGESALRVQQDITR